MCPTPHGPMVLALKEFVLPWEPDVYIIAVLVVTPGLQVCTRCSRKAGKEVLEYDNIFSTQKRKMTLVYLQSI